jgi:hypothetical protein
VGLANPLSPPSFALEHATQRLTARRAAKPLARTALRGNEVVFAPGTVTGEKFGFGGWALALAGGCHVAARGIRPPGNGRLGLGGTPSRGAATAVPATLVPAFLLAVGGPPVLPAGSPAPPSPCRRAALGATVPGLRVGGSKELLAPFEQTPPLPGPTSPLTGSRQAASLEWAQGSANFPWPSLGCGVRYAPPRGASDHPLGPRDRFTPSTLKPIRSASKVPRRAPLR